jgi:hypothetical protein
VQGLQKLGKNQQIQVQEEVFGSKQILKMSEFLNADFSKLSDEFKGVSPEKVTAAAEKTSSLEDLKQTLGSVRELNDFVAKSGKINENMIILRNEQEKRLAEIDNKRIASYESLAQIEAASTEIVDIAKSGILALTSMVVKITDLSANIKKITGSRFIRGILGQGGKDE